MSTIKENYLTLKEKACYGLGDVGNGFMFDLGQIYLLNFYTDTLGLPPASAGLVFLLTKIFDAFSDFGVGIWVDKRKNIGPRGKFRPFILYGAVPLCLITIASFYNPDFSITGKLVWVYFSYILFGLIYSIVNIPYGSILPVMTKNAQERNQLASWRQGGSNLGLLITTIGFIPLTECLKHYTSNGLFISVIVFACAGMVLQLICYKGLKENTQITSPKLFRRISIADALKSIFHNTPLLLLCLVNLFTFSAFNVKLVVQVYYCRYVFNDVNILPYMGFFSIGCIFIGVALVPTLTKLWGKKSVFILGCAIWIFGDLINYFMGNNLFLFTLFSCFAFLGSAFVNSLYWAFASDAVEYGEWQSRARTEGMIYAFFTFSRKLSQAIAGFIPGVVLGLVGYVPNATQTITAQQGIKGLIFLYPAALALVTLLIWQFFYHLNEQTNNDILRTLTVRKKYLSILQSIKGRRNTSSK